MEAHSEAMTELVSNEGKLEKEFEELETESAVFSDYELIKNKLKEEEEEQKKFLEEEKKNKKINQILDTPIARTDSKKLPEDKKKLLDGFMNIDPPKADEQKQKKIDNFFNKD